MRPGTDRTGTLLAATPPPRGSSGSVPQWLPKVSRAGRSAGAATALGRASKISLKNEYPLRCSNSYAKRPRSPATPRSSWTRPARGPPRPQMCEWARAVSGRRANPHNRGRLPERGPPATRARLASGSPRRDRGPGFGLDSLADPRPLDAGRTATLPLVTCDDLPPVDPLPAAGLPAVLDGPERRLADAAANQPRRAAPAGQPRF